MRLRVQRLALVGTPRELSLGPGLNIIGGPITTGKSTLLKLIRGLIGSSLSDLPVEVRERVSALAGQLLIDDREFDVVRPLTTSQTAKIDIAGDGEAERLPALRPERGQRSYGMWLLEHLDLPVIRVPAAPTRPGESAFTPVSINDYMLYCHLDQDEIDSSVFGHTDSFKNIKRKYVFELLYGLYDAETARLQEDLKDAQTALRLAEQGTAAFEELLEGTAFANRAELEGRLSEALNALEVSRSGIQVEPQRLEPEAQDLRIRVGSLDATISNLRLELGREDRAIADLRVLANQLETQSARLTKSIVAGGIFFDLDFRVCPRCGTNVDLERSAGEVCYLCLQTPSPQLTREDLIEELERVQGQLDETESLIRDRETRLVTLSDRLASVEEERTTLSQQLEQAVSAYLSDQEESIRTSAQDFGAAHASVQHLREYMNVYERLDANRHRADQLSERVASLEAQIDQRSSRTAESEERIRHLETRFAEYVDKIGTPRFEGEPRAAIDRATYLPILNGRRFSELSSGGLKVLTNVAYALAHHRTALDLDLPLPGILLIDGVTKNVGHDEYDWERVESVFRALSELGDAAGDRIQLIVAANDVPSDALKHVRLNLSASQRLIPNP